MALHLHAAQDRDPWYQAFPASDHYLSVSRVPVAAMKAYVFKLMLETIDSNGSGLADSLYSRFVMLDDISRLKFGGVMRSSRMKVIFDENSDFREHCNSVLWRYLQ
jgi:hypothetical protein